MRAIAALITSTFLLSASQAQVPHKSVGGAGWAGRKHKPARVILLRADAKGQAKKADAKRLFQRRRNYIRYCYEKRWLVQPKLRGKLSLTFSIDKKGTARMVRASGFDPKVDACVVRVFQRIRDEKKSGEYAYQVRLLPGTKKRKP